MRNKKITMPQKARKGKLNGLWKGGVSRDYSRAKVGLKPNSGILVHHKDGNPKNNKLSNLIKLKITGGPKSKTSRIHEQITKRK